MKPTNFAQYMSTYLTVYLPGVKGVSYNTIASKRDTYCCNDEKDKYVGNIFIENDIEVNKRCLTHY